MTLRAATRLGDNTVPILCDIVDALRRAGFDIAFDPDARVDQPDLLFACGLLTVQTVAAGAPYSVVAAPVFPGETQPVYRSVIVARSERHGEAMAVNEYESWSGWHGYLADDRPVPTKVVLTGTHVDSVAAVASSAADFAAIDSSIWADLVEQGGDAAHLVVVSQTRDYPAPPLSLHDRVADPVRTRLIDALRGQDQLRPAEQADYALMQRVGEP